MFSVSSSFSIGLLFADRWDTSEENRGLVRQVRTTTEVGRGCIHKRRKLTSVADITLLRPSTNEFSIRYFILCLSAIAV